MNTNPTLPAAPLPPPKPATLCLRPNFTASNLPPIDQGTALLADDKLTIPDELVHGLLHRATKGVLGGSSKAGKTWLLLDLALSVATGTRFLQWPTTQGRVLFANLEIHRAFLKSRLQQLVERKGVANLDSLDIWNLRGKSSDADALLRAIIKRGQEAQYSLIILDPVYKLMVGRAENAATGVGVLCSDIDRVVVETGAAVVYAHHFTKGNQAGKKAMDRLSGSGVFSRDADTIVTLTEHQEEGCFTVEMILRNQPEQQPFVVEWDYPLMIPRNDLDPSALSQGNPQPNPDMQEYLLSLLEEQPFSTAAWRELAVSGGVSRATFYRHQARLEASGKLQLSPLDQTWTQTEKCLTGVSCET